MMSAYRELKNEAVETTELDAHLETCAACREVLASYSQVGEQLRFASALKPQADAHARLMKALADEQLKFLQKSAPGKASTPEFLKPYLQERVRETGAEDDITAFSTAETGPLPLIHARRKRRRIPVNQFAVLGLAASILILLMMGGLTSLLMVARNNPNSIFKNTVSLARQTEVNQKSYTTDTIYRNVASAIPSDNFVFYTASGDEDNSNTWMLMQFDRTTQLSVPLLNTASDQPLIVLAASNSWVIWLEYSRPQFQAHGTASSSGQTYTPAQPWHLYYLSLLPQAPSTPGNIAGSPGQTPTPPTNQGQPIEHAGNQETPTSGEVSLPTPVLLTQGIFNSQSVPEWIKSPLQGLVLAGNTVLVAQVNEQGVSTLTSYPLSGTGKSTTGVEIARAMPDHILNSPTIDSTGTLTYWADEWTSEDGVLHSNIWEQQAHQVITRQHGYPVIQSSYTQSVLLDDGMSFHPQVVADTLFFMSTSEMFVSSGGAVQEPNGTPLPITSMDTSVTFTPSTDQTIYPSPADASLHGTVFMIPLNGSNVSNESMLGTVGQSTMFQAGTNYVIWQDSTGYRMYDVARQSEVTLGNTLNNASLLVVSDNTTMWFTGNAADSISGKLSFMLYTWPV